MPGSWNFSEMDKKVNIGAADMLHSKTNVVSYLINKMLCNILNFGSVKKLHALLC